MLKLIYFQCSLSILMHWNWWLMKIVSTIIIVMWIFEWYIIVISFFFNFDLSPYFLKWKNRNHWIKKNVTLTKSVFLHNCMWCWSRAVNLTSISMVLNVQPSISPNNIYPYKISVWHKWMSKWITNKLIMLPICTK